MGVWVGGALGGAPRCSSAWPCVTLTRHHTLGRVQTADGQSHAEEAALAASKSEESCFAVSRVLPGGFTNVPFGFYRVTLTKRTGHVLDDCVVVMLTTIFFNFFLEIFGLNCLAWTLRSCAGFTEQLEGMHEFSHDTRFHTYAVDLEALNLENSQNSTVTFLFLFGLSVLTHIILVKVAVLK